MIATMHSAKGLEFHTVFIPDANEGIIPHKKAALPEDIEEERRLLYVAMTRAKKALYIYSAKERYNKVAPWSRFIDELTGSNKEAIPNSHRQGKHP
jgi:DNA helicase-2/ATP-dependent DNA helicase PcrA